jgi:NAD(P)-dependent dehydrogenase (short-subunit alcohol dehydrogenase family)
MNGVLSTKVALITGSGRGIGKATALAMAKEGARVVTNDVIAGSAESTAKEIMDMGGQAVAFSGDISMFDIAQKLVQTGVDNFGKIDILVNNAGVTGHCMVWDMTEEMWDRLISINLKGSFNCIRHVSKLMKEQRWGRILNATSVAWLGVYEGCSYGAAKAGVVGLTRAVARDMGRYGVTCNAFAPWAKTMIIPPEKRAGRFRRMYEAGFLTRQQYEEIIDSDYRPTSETIPPLLIYLCTDEAADINGQVFDIKGGNISIYSDPAIRKTIRKEDLWTVEQLIETAPRVLLQGYKNPAPAWLLE